MLLYEHRICSTIDFKHALLRFNIVSGICDFTAEQEVLYQVGTRTLVTLRHVT